MIDIWFVTLRDAGNPIVGVVSQIKFKSRAYSETELVFAFICLINFTEIYTRGYEWP